MSKFVAGELYRSPGYIWSIACTIFRLKLIIQIAELVERLTGKVLCSSTDIGGYVLNGKTLYPPQLRFKRKSNHLFAKNELVQTHELAQTHEKTRHFL